MAETEPAALEATAPSTTAPTTTGSTAPTGPFANVSGKTIAIDPGHNGGNASHLAQINQQVDAGNGVHKECDTTGTAGNDGYPEYAFNLTVSLMVRDLLTSAGAHVVMVRTDNSGWGPCITERARIGNDARADAAISIHADGNLSQGARGFHVILPQATSLNAAIAQPSAVLGTDVRNEVVKTGMPESNYMGANGLITRGDLGGLNLSTVPKVFIECGNMRNTTDLALLEDPGFQHRLAVAIAGGINDYLGS